MAFTPDQLPAIGEVRPGVLVAVACNGYGGSYTTAAGQAVAEMVTTGRAPDWLPADVFSPHRLTSEQPIFLSEKEGLWRIAASLCRQLHSVNRRISEALTLRTETDASAVPGQQAPRVSRMLRASRIMRAVDTTLDPATLAPFPAFADFEPAELAELARALRRLELSAGTLLFTEGDAGGTCFVVITGVVDVSVKVRGQPQLLAQLGPGSIFGQASLIEGSPRSASCSIRRDAVLAEIDREACERLLAGPQAIALKLLGALNRGLIAALREADHRLMRLELRREMRSSGEWAMPARRRDGGAGLAGNVADTVDVEHAVPLASI
jgi:CRP-like cAMP-binding protein